MKQRIRGSRRGGAMVEFALVVPVMVLLFLGTVFFGYDFHMYDRLEESVRAGARYGSMQTYDAYNSGKDPAPSHCTSCQLVPTSGPFVTKVKNVVAYGCDPSDADPSGTACPQTPVVEGVLPENVKVTLEIRNWVPKYVTVAIENVPMRTPFGSFTLSGKPVTTFQYVGDYKAPLPPKNP